MDLQTALRLFPAPGEPLNVMAPLPTHQDAIAAAQALADAFRRLYGEQSVILRLVRSIGANAVQTSEYAMVRMEDLQAVLRAPKLLYQAPALPIPPLQPPN